MNDHIYSLDPRASPCVHLPSMKYNNGVGADYNEFPKLCGFIFAATIRQNSDNVTCVYGLLHFGTNWYIS